jgi:hypothetical protein
VRLGEGDREGKAGEAGAGAQVADRCGAGELGRLEAGEAVGQMDVERFTGLADGRGGIGLGGQRREEPAERLGGAGRQPEAGGQGRDRFP